MLFLLFPFMMAISAFYDLVSYRLPNELSLILMAGFFPFAFLAGMPLELIGLHMLAGFMILVITFTLFCFGLFGGGDAKILSAAALWIGFDNLMEFFILVTFAGGFLSLVIINFRNLPDKPVFYKYEWLRGLYLGDEKDIRTVPYAIAIAFAGLLYIPNMQIFSIAIKTTIA
jgi:prepilin peptidase CpaA